MPSFSISTWISIGGAVIILLLLGYCKVLSSEKSALESKNGELTLALTQKTAALDLCSKNTQALKDADRQVTEAAVAAVVEAKKDAKAYYDNANALLKNKVIVQPITKDNIKNYGGVDPVARAADCNAAHQVLNNYVDTRATRKVGASK